MSSPYSISYSLILKVSKSIFIGVYTTLFVMSVGFSFLTHGCPNIYLIPPKDPNLRLGYLIRSPSKSILISAES